jgi:hypothetical protein
MCFQELFYGPYFCQVQDTEYYDYTEPSPTARPPSASSPGQGDSAWCWCCRCTSRRSPGLYYNTAAVIDADGTYLGKYRKQHIPQTKGFWEKFYFAPGTGGYPIFDTAVGKVGVYICYDRHFPEGWRALGLNGAEIVFNPSATTAGCREYLWRIEQPAAAVANMYYVGAINRVGIEPLGDNDFYGRATSSTRGQVRRRRRRPVQARADRARPRHGQDHRGARPLGVLPRPPPGRLRRPDRAEGTEQEKGRSPMARTLIKNGKVISPTGVIAQDVLIDGETIVRSARPATSPRRARRPHIDATGKYVIPGRHRRAHAHGAAVRRHLRVRHVRDRHPRRGVGRHHHHRRHGRAALRRATCTDGLAEWHRKADGNCAIDYAFHQIIGGVDDQSLKDMKYLVEHEGITSFKLFMAYPGVFYSDDGQILRAMQTAAECGAMIMMHAENGIAIDVLVQQALARGETDPEVPQLHPAVSRSRPRPRTAPSCSATSPATCRCTSCTCRPATRSTRSPPPATTGATCSPRPARSTSTSPLEETLGSPASRAPSGCAAPRCVPDHDPDYIGQMGHGTRATCGRACA